MCTLESEACWEDLPHGIAATMVTALDVEK